MPLGDKVTGGYAMLKGRNKRVVILKDIPSNIIEEAILVLRTNVPEDNGKKTVIVQGKKGFANGHILSEARMIINDYISENKAELNGIGALNLKPYSPNKKRINFIINSVLFCSVILLAVLIYKVF